jgi:hypothetical protein
MFKVLILVCSAHLAPQDCQTDNAGDVIWGPDATNAITCAFTGQAYIADTAVAAGIGRDQYVKVQCIRPPTKETVETDPDAAKVSRLDRHEDR